MEGMVKNSLDLILIDLGSDFNYISPKIWKNVNF